MVEFFAVRDAKKLCAERDIDVVRVDGSASLWVKGFYPWYFRRKPINRIYEWLARRYPSMFARDFIIVGRKRGIH